jgi:hypothetical protein
MQKTCENCGAIGGCEWCDDDEKEDNTNLEIIDRNVLRFFQITIGVCVAALAGLAGHLFLR